MIGKSTGDISKGQHILVVSSITYAYKARDYLFNMGIKCYIDRIPAHLRNSGCGYGVRITGDADKITAILENAGIHVKDVV